jgi:hypothetical protein
MRRRGPPRPYLRERSGTAYERRRGCELRSGYICRGATSCHENANVRSNPSRPRISPENVSIPGFRQRRYCPRRANIRKPTKNSRRAIRRSLTGRPHVYHQGSHVRRYRRATRAACDWPHNCSEHVIYQGVPGAGAGRHRLLHREHSEHRAPSRVARGHLRPVIAVRPRLRTPTPFRRTRRTKPSYEAAGEGNPVPRVARLQ